MRISKTSSFGFTLIEALVTVAVAAVIMGIGVPELGVYSNNQKIKAAAGNVAAAIQSARLDAVRQNLPVQLVFTSSDPVIGSVTAPNLSRSGPNWIVRRVDGAGFAFLEGFATTSLGQDSSGNPIVTMNASAGAGPLTSIEFSPLARATFNPLSGGSAATQGFIDIANPLGGACQTSNTDSRAMRCLRVVVSLGGQAKVCDPLVTDTKDTRRC